MSSEHYRAVAVAGGALGVVGAVLPWMADAGFGLDVYSVFALVAGMGVVAVGVTRWNARSRYAVGALAAVVFLLALEAIMDFANNGPPEGVPVAAHEPGVGVYLSLAGGALALTGVALARLADREHESLRGGRSAT